MKRFLLYLAALAVMVIANSDPDQLSFSKDSEVMLSAQLESIHQAWLIGDGDHVKSLGVSRMDKSVESNKEGEPNKMVEFDSSPPSHGPPAPPHVTNNGTHYQPPHHGSHNHPHHHHSFFDRIKRFFGFPTPSPHCRGPPPPPRHHRQHEGRNSTEPTPELEGIQVEMIENEMEINNQTHHHGPPPHHHHRDHHCGPAPPHQHRKSFLKKSSNKISEFFEDLSFTSYVLLLFASKMVLVSGIVGIIKTIKKRNNGEIQLKEEKAPGILPEYRDEKVAVEIVVI